MRVLSLNDILGASIVEAEDLVVQVQAVGVGLETPFQLVTGLGVELVMRIEVVVALR